MLRKYKLIKNTHPFLWVITCVALQGIVWGQSGITVELLTDLPEGESIEWVSGMSDDGSVIVGYGETPQGMQAYRWENGTLTWLGDLQGGGFESRANSVSADGKVVVGYSSSEFGIEAFRWEDGSMIGLGDLPGGEFHSEAKKISADGSTIIGIGYSTEGQTAFRWKNGFMEELDAAPGGYSWKEVTAVSADGNIIYGSGELPEGSSRTCLMWQDGVTSITDFGMGSGDGDLTIDLVLENGDMLIGNIEFYYYGISFTPFLVIDGSVFRLPFPSYGLGDFGDKPMDASNDGGIITGIFTVWIRELQYRPVFLNNLLDYAGVVPEGFQIGGGFAVSADGTVLVGIAARETTGKYDSIFRMVIPPEFISSIPQDEVQIPDAFLRSRILSEIGQYDTVSAITQSDMESLTSLNCSGTQIEDLTGLEAATNLTELRLRGCRVRDFSPLEHLENLKLLDLFRNGLTDISSLSNLTSLENLQLHQNNITDINPLRNMIHMVDLNLDSNNISDLGPLSGMTKLERLCTGNNNLADLEPLSNLKSLVHIELYNNILRDISPLAKLTQLYSLELENNEISDIRPLVALVNLWDEEGTPGLRLNGNYIDLTPGSTSIQIISQLDSKSDLTVTYLPQREFSYWEGYPLRADGSVDFWDWIGELDINMDPWMWSEEMQCWVYLDSEIPSGGEGWCFIPDFNDFPICEIPGTEICYHFGNKKWMLATDSGWVYVFPEF